MLGLLTCRKKKMKKEERGDVSDHKRTDHGQHGDMRHDRTFITHESKKCHPMLNQELIYNSEGSSFCTHAEYPPATSVTPVKP